MTFLEKNCNNLTYLPLENYDLCAEVTQQGMGFTSCYDKKPYIFTYGCDPCICIVGYNHQYNIGFILHIDNKNILCDKSMGNIYYNLSKIYNHYKPKTSIKFDVLIYGAKTTFNSENRKQLIDYIYSQFSKYNIYWKDKLNINIVQNNIGKNNNTTSVCLNTQTGKIYKFNPKYFNLNNNKILLRCNEIRKIINSYKEEAIMSIDYIGKYFL